MYRYRLIILILALFSVPLSSQSDQPPAPADVFAPDVEIREITVPVEQGRPIDNDLRMMILGDTLVPFPDFFDEVGSFEPLDDHRFLIHVTENTPASGFGRSQGWVYDLETQQFDLFKDACGVLDGRNMSGYLPESGWIIMEKDDDYVLCELATGTMSDPLPPDRNWESRDDNLEPTLSPDGQWLAFIGYSIEIQRDSERDVYLYSLETATNEIRFIGHLVADISLYFGEWVGSQIMVNTGGTCSIYFRALYIADASRTESIEMALGTNVGSWVFYDDPPRYVLGYDTPYAQTYCGRRTFFVETRELVQPDLDGLCRPEYGDVDAVGYYRDVPTGNTGMTSECCLPRLAEVAEVPVVRYDSRTGERTELYRGEVEQIEWVSPDERYTILLMDQNGVIDLFPYIYDSWNDVNYSNLESKYLALVDLETGEELYRNYVFDVSDVLLPLSENTFISTDCNFLAACGGWRLSANRLRLENNKLEFDMLVSEGVVAWLPDPQLVLFWATEDPHTFTFHDLSLYNLNTGETTLLLNRLDPARYRVRLEAGDSSVLVRILPAETNRALVDYTVKFTEDGQPYVEIVTQQIVTPFDEYICFVTPNTGVNLRADAGGDFDRVGTAEAGERLIGIGQKVSENDGLIWWMLQQGGWVRDDFVTKTPACNTIPDLNTVPEADIIPAQTASQFAVTCEVEVLQGVNLRGGPGTGYEQVGSAAEGFVLTAVGKFTSTEDFLTWWRLDTGEWVREDFVSEESGCSAIPVMDPSGELPAPVTSSSDLACDVTVMQGVNLRGGPGSQYDRVGSAAEGFVLKAIGQAANPEDTFTWWKLETGEWIREDFVSEGVTCAILPNVDTP